MGNFVAAGKTSEFGDGTTKKVSVQGQEILLARVGNDYYAVQSRCPHMGGDLSAGRLEGSVVTCPLHKSQFDLKDGHVVRWMKGAGLAYTIGKAIKPPRPLKMYPVKVEGEAVLVEV
jgi:3-phenylpropionate/trans-cinnamate dioxygenase ferredoxin subunit